MFKDKDEFERYYQEMLDAGDPFVTEFEKWFQEKSVPANTINRNSEAGATNTGSSELIEDESNDSHN